MIALLQEARSKEEEEVCSGLRLAIVMVTMAGFTVRKFVVLCDQTRDFAPNCCDADVG